MERTEQEETQESISKWAEEKFGPVGSNARVAARANEEMAELLRALSADDNSPKAAEEAADVVIVLYRLADRLGFGLDTPGMFPAVAIAPNNLALAAAANESMALTLKSLAADDRSYAAEYGIRQIVALLGTLAFRMKFDLLEEVGRKMETNRHKREWKLDGSGHGYHVRGKD